jgi:hypothetical protein
MTAFDTTSALNLALWPGLFVLGLLAMGLMFAFIVACEKV